MDSEINKGCYCYQCKFLILCDTLDYYCNNHKEFMEVGKYSGCDDGEMSEENKEIADMIAGIRRYQNENKS